MFRRIWPAVLLVSSIPVAFAAGTPAPDVRATPFQEHEPNMAPVMRRSPQFSNVAHISSRPSCEDVQPPTALSTSSPLFAASSYGRRVKVRFIIGTDRRVHILLVVARARLVGD